MTWRVLSFQISAALAVEYLEDPARRNSKSVMGGMTNRYNLGMTINILRHRHQADQVPEKQPSHRKSCSASDQTESPFSSTTRITRISVGYPLRNAPRSISITQIPSKLSY
jgi:hypothetical protein